MSFLAGLNGGSNANSTLPKASGSSRFLSGIRQSTPEENAAYEEEVRMEAETARQAEEQRKARSPLGITKSVVNAVVGDPMKTLATPVIRAEQALASLAGRAIGGNFGRNLETAANQPLEFPSIVGGSAGTIEPQRGFDDGGAKQIAGDVLKYGATIYTGGKVPPVTGTALKGTILRAGTQGAKEGAIGAGAYMGGDELQRRDSTVKSVIEETGKGLALGGFLGGVLGGGGAALAKPGAMRAAAEAEATRLRPLPVQNMDQATSETIYHSSSDKFAGDRPEFDAYFGTPEWKKDYAQEFGENEYELGLPKNDRVVDLNQDTQQAREIRAQIAEAAFPEDKAYAASLRAGDPSAMDEFYGDIWTDKNNISSVLRANGLDGAKFRDEYLLTKEAIAGLPKPNQGAEVNVRRFKNIPVQNTDAKEITPQRLYHGTESEFDAFDPSMDPEDFGTWFAKDRAFADETKMPIIMERDLRPGTKLITEAQLSKLEKTREWLDSEEPFYELLMKKGYRGIKYGNDTVQLFDPEADTILPGAEKFFKEPRARNVPINRAPEPYLTEAEMPSIQMGPKPKTSGVEVSKLDAPDVYAPAPKETRSTPTTVYRGETKNRSYGGVIKAKSEFGTAPFVSFTDSQELASRFGEKVNTHSLDMNRILDLESSKDKAAVALIDNEIDPSAETVAQLKKMGYDGISFNNLENSGQKGKEIRYFGDFGPEKSSATTDIGITSFRGKPVKTVGETAPYYNTARAKGFENNLNTTFKQYNLPNPEIEKAAGSWEGSVEPSFIVRLKVELNDDVRAYAVAAAKKANQDAVIFFSKGSGKSTKYTFKTKSPDKTLKALHSEGISGATVEECVLCRLTATF